MPRPTEINFDGLIGPTHNYAGLGVGNIASTQHGGQSSSPKQAALQGLAKMRLLAERGIEQAILPPQRRPRIDALRAIGFTGDDADVVQRAAVDAPHLLAACYSASSMWTANAATVSPSADARDGRVHITPANLCSQWHRALEAEETTAILRQIFCGDEQESDAFVVHDPLPSTLQLADEGAANHTRLCKPGAIDQLGLELFTFGRKAAGEQTRQPLRYPARQTLDASQSVARRHDLLTEPMFIQQNPAAIDAGVFHNDVIAVGHENVLLYHENAYVDTATIMDQIKQRFTETTGEPLVAIEVTAAELSLDEAVRSYLFNSQLVTADTGRLVLIYPVECDESPAARAVIERILADDNPIAEAHVVSLRQSMNNGGGPACLRLRVVLTDAQRAAIHQDIRWTPTLHAQLADCIERRYRDELSPDDLRDPNLIAESWQTQSELQQILGLEL